jgi:hypothetical protein
MAKKIDPEVEDKLALARKNVEVLKVQMDEDIDVANEMAYSDEELERLLKRLPVVMFRQSQVVVLKFIDFKDAKRKVKKELALAMMQANQQKETLSSAEDRKAWAQNSRNVEMAEIDLINAEAEYKMAEFHFSAYDNLYMAVKKMIDKRTAENAAQERANRT